MTRLTKIVASAAVATATAIGGLVWWLAGGLPSIDGTLRLAGLKAPVTIGRDAAGVPRILAQSAEDAYFALGFVHAQDRLWQMEMQRRAGAGRLAEILGEAALPTDRFTRTLGLYRLAEQSLSALSPEVRAALDAYAAGVNAFITAPSSRLPPEFLLLRQKPEPWTPADSMVWGKLMAMQLAGNWRDELLRAKLSTVLPADMVADLWPPYDPEQPVTIGLDRPLLDAMLAAIPPLYNPRLASNVWVISGERSQTGKPILANDPHLAFQAPTLWYLAVLAAPDLAIGGATVPGMPFHLIGHNRRIAWGFTTTHSDTMDLFVERPEGHGYQTPDGVKPFVTRQETIKVRGGGAETLTIRETRHGPVISDLLGPRAGGQILALCAAALGGADTTAQAIYHVNRAADWTGFREALRDYQVPQQNIAYADVDGHIGLISPGWVPIRKSGDGTLPRPGWSGDFDWTGWIPFEALPQVTDPASGVIVNANNKLVGDSYPYLLTAVWPPGYRAQRISERLDDQPRFSVDDMAALQMDELSLMALELKPLLLAIPPRGARAAIAYRMLEGWNGVASPQAPEPLIFTAWARRLQRNLLSPWLGPQAEAFAVLDPQFLKAVLSGRHAWCGGPGKTAPISCPTVVADALDKALDDLTHRYGEDMSQWHWGEAHQARFDALLFGHVPIADRLTTLSAPTGGDDYTVSRGSIWNVEPADFTQGHGAGMRAVFDLADLEASRFVIATGQSGNPFSPHWSDQLADWLAGRSWPLPPRRDLPHALVLEPE
jgi:penicillin amidase